MSSTNTQEPVAWRYKTPTGWHATTDAAKALAVKAHHEMEPLYAAPVSAEPVAHRLLRRNGDGEWVHDAKHWVNGWPPPELIRDCGQTPELYRIEVAYAAPVAAQSDLTQQTLDDVMAGIPARDAEIEALRKEIEALQAAPVKPYSLDLDPAGIRALTADAISGALALGFQGVSPPPNNEHWLAPFWEIGRESAVQAQQPVSGADGLPQGWRMVPEKIPMKGLDDAIAWMRPAMNQAGRDLAYCLTGAWSILLDSVTPPDHLPDATKMVEPSGNSGELHASFESWRKSELPWTSPATPGIGFAWDAWRARAALAQQDAETGKSVSVENQWVTQHDAEKVQADLLSSLVEIVDAVIASDEEGLIEHSETIIKARAAIDAARKEPDQ